MNISPEMMRMANSMFKNMGPSERENMQKMVKKLVYLNYN